MKHLLFLIVLLAMTTECSTAPVNRDAILSAYSKLNLTGGVNEDEMKIIAQRCLLLATDEPCKSDAQEVKIGSPHIKCSWVDPEQRDGGCYIGFSKKATFEMVPLYVKVSDVTGKATCAGHLILK